MKKSLNLEHLGVQEMNSNELLIVNGGGFWSTLVGIGAAVLCVGLAIGSTIATGGGAALVIAGLLGSVDEFFSEI